MYEELIRSCRACATGYVGNCDNCMFSGKDCYKQLHKASADAIEELSKPRNTVHLCTSCKYQYPECPADTGVVFGRGKGNDNICQCADYVAKIPHWIPVTERLPFAESGNVSEKVLVTDGQDIAIAEWFNFEMCEPYWSYTGMGDITHWMPLPEPPKEK